MKTSAEGIKFIAKWEGTILKAYQDGGGVWTIGVGHTSAAGLPKVTKGLVITKDQSDEILSRDIVAVEKQVLSAVKVPLSQNQFDALVSFTFNVGPGALNTSTALRRLNAKDYNGAADALTWFNKDNGKTVDGLTKRRAAEKVLFLTADKTAVVVETPVVVPEKPVETVPVVVAPEVPVEAKPSLLDVILRIIRLFTK